MCAPVAHTCGEIGSSLALATWNVRHTNTQAQTNVTRTTTLTLALTSEDIFGNQPSEPELGVGIGGTGTSGAPFDSVNLFGMTL